MCFPTIESDLCCAIHSVKFEFSPFFCHKNINIIRVETFMRVTYPYNFGIRLKSIEFNEKNMNLEILTIFYSHIICIFPYFFCYSHILQIYLRSFHFVAKLRVKILFLFNINLK